MLTERIPDKYRKLFEDFEVGNLETIKDLPLDDKR